MGKNHPPLLGDLETAVMERLWSRGAADVKAVHGVLGPARRITLNTVQSTMERLYRKGLLSREKVRHAFVYSPRLSREDARAQILQEVVRRVVGVGTDLMLSTLVDLAARSGDGTLVRLERMVTERRAQTGRRS